MIWCKIVTENKSYIIYYYVLLRWCFSLNILFFNMIFLIPSVRIRHSFSIITVELAESRSRFVPMAHGRWKNANHLKYTHSTLKFLFFFNFETSSTDVRSACCLQLCLCIYVCLRIRPTLSLPLLWFIYLLIITAQWVWPLCKVCISYALLLLG